MILTRRNGERIRIGDDIEIVVFVTRSNEVRVGIEAPLHVKVLREEVYKRDQQGKVPA